MDFGSRSGTVGATFDNRSYSGTSFFKDNVSGFEGSLTSNDAGPATRALFDGSFVRNGEDPVGGMIGTKRFFDDATNGNKYRASTTFAGKKIPDLGN